MSVLETEVIDCGDRWNQPPVEALLRVVSILAEEQAWKNVALSVQLVNKHWRDALRFAVATVAPHICQSFPKPHDFNTLSAFPCLRNLSFRISPHNYDPTLEGGTIYTLSRLRRLKIIADGEVPFMDQIRQMYWLRHLHLEQLSDTIGHSREWNAGMPMLKTLHLRNFPFIAEPSFVRGLLRSHTHLETLELLHDTKPCIIPMDTLTTLDRLRRLRMDSRSLTTCNTHIPLALLQLTHLVLDSCADYDVLDLSFLQRLKHLSLDSKRMPLWLTSLVELDSLELRTPDHFSDEDRRSAILSKAPKLKSLSANFAAVTEEFMAEILKKMPQLEELTIHQHRFAGEDVLALENLKRLKVVVTQNWHKILRMGVVTNIFSFANLQSLDLNLPAIPSLPKFHLRPNWDIQSTLTKLVLSGLPPHGLCTIYYTLKNLTDLRIRDPTHSSSPVVCGGYGQGIGRGQANRGTLRNLCFSCRRRPEALPCDLDKLLEWPVVMELDHLALPSCLFKQEIGRARIDAFRTAVPRVIVDDDFDWKPKSSM